MTQQKEIEIMTTMPNEFSLPLDLAEAQKRADEVYAEIDRSIATLEEKQFAPGADAAERFAVVYKAVRPLLDELSRFVMFADSWKAALVTLIATLDDLAAQPRK
jgi:hypothetical protein